MTLFLFIWVFLVLAAAGLAVGTLRGRDLRRGACAGSAVSGRSDAACQGCTPADALRRHPTNGGS